MAPLHGDWFDGRSAQKCTVQLILKPCGQVQVINTSTQELLAEAPLQALHISSPLGQTARSLYFPEGGKCETFDHQALQCWLTFGKKGRAGQLLHLLESHTYSLLAAIVCVALFTWGFIGYGLPALARQVAFNLPISVLHTAGQETLQLLDKTQLNATTLDATTQARVQALLAPMLQEHPELPLKILFRKGGSIGANALALPDGTLILTDEMVQLAEQDSELVAVMAHEVGHIKERHALRTALQGSVLSFALATLVGDVSASAHILASLPVILTSLSYSRDFEREADRYALEYLNRHQIKPEVFTNLLDRAQAQAECTQLMNEQPSSTQHSTSSSSSGSNIQWVNMKTHKQTCADLIAKNTSQPTLRPLLGFLSTHPANTERRQRFNPPTRTQTHTPQ